MAEYDQSNIKVEEGSAVEATDRGLFNLGKKEEVKKCDQGQAISAEFDEKVRVSEPDKEEGKKHGGLLEKLHRSGSSSSSSSEEEVEEGGEKKKKKKEKKGLKDKIKEKISGDKKDEEKVEKCEEGTSIPVEKYAEPAHADAAHEPEEKKGFLDKIKEKLPGGGQKKTEEVAAAAPPPPPAECTATEGEAKDKKGFLDKIKEKLPGYHPKTEEEKEKEKEKEKEAGCH
ncbi:dehydrin COR47-like [Coffea arabica]|uniref:Dehydrin COR47-like n=1 Tax=Coffea arabica TaxID=13443 RepID=A0ABM4VTT1_COFAR